MNEYIKKLNKEERKIYRRGYLSGLQTRRNRKEINIGDINSMLHRYDAFRRMFNKRIEEEVIKRISEMIPKTK